MLTEYHTSEMATATERKLWNALKFGTSREVNTKKGDAPAEGLLLPPHNCIEVGVPQIELDRALGEARIQQPPLQCPRTKLIFDIRIDDQFLD